MLINKLLPGETPAIDNFFRQLTTDDELFAAQVLFPECTAVIRAEVYARRVARDDGERLLFRMFQIPFQQVESPSQFLRAFELAEQFQQRRGYDMQYLAVAELVGAELVTGDRGLAHAAREIGVPVQVIS